MNTPAGHTQSFEDDALNSILGRDEDTEKDEEDTEPEKEEEEASC
jgi:hypothetical protein